MNFINKFKRDLKRRLGVPDLNNSMERLKDQGYNPSFILDIGAYEGLWSVEMMEFFPNATYHLFEGQPNKSEVLKNVIPRLPKNSDFHIALLGAESGAEVNFNINDTVSSVLDEHFEQSNATKQKFKLHTLDELISDKLSGRGLVKLDVQGYELEVLKGAKEVLKKSDVLMLEVSLIDINKGAPLAHEVLSALHEQGFLMYDIFELIRRPLDKALWQINVLMVREGHVLISSKKYI